MTDQTNRPTGEWKTRPVLDMSDLDAWLTTVAPQMPESVYTLRRLIERLGDACEAPPHVTITGTGPNGIGLLSCVWNTLGVCVSVDVCGSLVSWEGIDTRKGHEETDYAWNEDVLVAEAARDVAPWLRRLFDARREEERAPVQGDGGRDARGRGPWKTPPGTIAWSEHLEVYEAYAKRFGRSQSAERMAERGGFGKAEAEKLLGRPLATWKPRT
ncbi:MAG: hypothetical protein MUE69_34205 [Myxococcota bacterium]|jgi:hypothetical protein|nr:hypothetical protein [Myxococcota bacterium]